MAKEYKPYDYRQKTEMTKIGGCYWNQKPDYVRRPLWGVSRTLKADGGHPAGILIKYGKTIKF